MESLTLGRLTQPFLLARQWKQSEIHPCGEWFPRPEGMGACISGNCGFIEFKMLPLSRSKNSVLSWCFLRCWKEAVYLVTVFCRGQVFLLNCLLLCLRLVKLRWSLEGCLASEKWKQKEKDDAGRLIIQATQAWLISLWSSHLWCPKFPAFLLEHLPLDNEEK